MERSGISGDAQPAELNSMIAWPERDKSVPLTDWDIRNISEALSRSGQTQWSKLPRIYAVLHSIAQTQSIKAFLDDSVTDLGFPFTNRALPHTFSDQAARKNFLAAQHLVASTVLEFEKGSKHYHFSQAEDVPLFKLSELGRGQFGSVDRVRSDVSFQEYARKLIPRGRTFQKDKKILRDFENELHSLRKLSHHHIVQLVGSYTDPKFVGIIMSPVADCNLKEYLWGNFESSLVTTFFGCLAVAIRFLHENQVRHKDIKPQNVLVYKGTVLLTDFGISRDWTKAGRETTTGQTPMTPKYCAPEVADWCPRNSSSDIWSLGCIFLEMFTVISGFSVNQLFQYLENNGSHSGNYHMNREGVDSWCKFAWPDTGSSGPLLWIQNMMKFEKNGRWTAQRLSDCIQEQSEDGEVSYVGQCCDTSIGSPQTVDSPPTGSTMQLDTAVPDAEASRHSSIGYTSTIGSLDFGHLAVTSALTDSRSRESSVPRENQVQPHVRNTRKREFAMAGRDVGKKKTKRAQRQQIRGSDEHQKGNEGSEFPSRQPPVNTEKHVVEDAPKELPASFGLLKATAFHGNRFRDS
jgi:serine/threonine protein kinase